MYSNLSVAKLVVGLFYRACSVEMPSVLSNSMYLSDEYFPPQSDLRKPIIYFGFLSMGALYPAN